MSGRWSVGRRSGALLALLVALLAAAALQVGPLHAGSAVVTSRVDHRDLSAIALPRLQPRQEDRPVLRLPPLPLGTVPPAAVVAVLASLGILAIAAPARPVPAPVRRASMRGPPPER